MKRSLIIKKLESVLSQKINDFYRKRLKQQLNDIQYYVFEKTIVIVIEGSVTQVERFLNDNDRQELAKQVRLAIDRIVKSQIKGLIEESLDVNVVDFLCDTSIDTNRTGAIVIFEFTPKSS
jgi:uncharacterized protein YbcI